MTTDDHKQSHRPTYALESLIAAEADWREDLDKGRTGEPYSRDVHHERGWECAECVLIQLMHCLHGSRKEQEKSGS
jgi:hypothetical protein